jgi:hypothetical protein
MGKGKGKTRKRARIEAGSDSGEEPASQIAWHHPAAKLPKLRNSLTQALQREREPHKSEAQRPRERSYAYGEHL